MLACGIKTLRSLILWVLLVFSNGLLADHVNGGEISYVHIKNKEYRIFLKLYRDCNECEFNQGNCLDITKLSLFAGKRHTSQTLKLEELPLTFESKKDVSSNCKTNISKCSGGSGNIGTEVWLWSTNIDFDTIDSKYCEFEIGVRVENRKAVYSSNKEAFYTSAILNRCNSQENNSAIFASDPIHKLQINESQSYSLLASDKDGDSLSYHLVKGQKAKGFDITYPTGLNDQKPIAVQCNSNCDYEPNVWPVQGFGINNFTGICSFTPNSANQQGFLVIEVKEWRKVNGTMELIGITHRDILLSTFSSPNHSTQLTIYEPEVFNCVKGMVQKDIAVYDPVFLSKTDSIHLAIFSPNGSSIIKDIRSKNNLFDALYEFTPSPGNRLYDFVTIVSSDNYCPLQNVAYSTIIIRYPETPEVKQSLLNPKCNVLDVKALQKNKSSQYDQWVLTDKQGNQISQSTGRSETWNLDSAGFIRVEHILNDGSNGCKTVVFDSIDILPFKKITAVTDFPAQICTNLEYVIESHATGGIGPFVKTWNGTFVADSFPLLTYKDTSLSLHLIDSRGCEFNYSNTIEVFSPSNIIAIDTGLCFAPGESYLLNELVKVMPVKNQNVHFTLLDGFGTLSNNPNNEYLYSASSSQIAKFSAIAIDENQCKYFDTLDLKIIEPVKSNMLRNKAICNNVGLVDLNLLSEKTIYGGFWYGKTISLSNQNYFFPSGKVGDHYFNYVHNEDGCVFEDSILIKLKESPVISFLQPRQLHLCNTSNDLQLVASPVGGTWMNADHSDGTIKPSLRYTSRPNSQVIYTYANTINGCKAVDSIHVIINPEIVYNLPKDIEFCSSEETTIKLELNNLLGPASLTVTGDINLKKISDDRFIIKNLVPKSTIENQWIQINANALKGCTDLNISIPIKVKPVPNVGFLAVDLKGCSPFLFKSGITVMNGVQPNEFEWLIDGRLKGTSSNFATKINESGNYELVLGTGLNGCKSVPVKANLIVLETVVPEIITDPSSKIISQDYPYIDLNDNSMSSVDYTREWFVPGGSLPNYTHVKARAEYPGDTGYYSIKLKIKTKEGCLSEDTVRVYLAPKYYFYIPTAFSPNATGPEKNEVFRPLGDKLTEYKLVLYNSLKNKVFETTNFNEGWTGTTPKGKAQAGVYIWSLEGRNDRGVLIQHKGLVTLVR